ncbi:hypothetical protein N7532_011595 [Penicillium argentinense]|uniref:Uncharacterized protein n=1 Tax=Penicillium argentinense TaxID=1131581 RepID=A0A9W9EIT5_9EURO|nr:uncharacterized protein N7532_011595 [Penicillium argentinense]KAJ5082552.1 hypothetical protein N7532_011595 [Penicillium argentinense]
MDRQAWRTRTGASHGALLTGLSATEGGWLGFNEQQQNETSIESGGAFHPGIPPEAGMGSG